MTDQKEKIKVHLEGIQMELNYLVENLGDYNRLQRKNVQEYLSGRIETLRNNIHPNDWLTVVNENFPSYENKELMHKFLMYSKDLMDDAERDLSTYSPMFKPAPHHT